MTIKKILMFKNFIDDLSLLTINLDVIFKTIAIGIKQ